MSKLSIFGEFFRFIRKSGSWWMIPIVLFLMILGALLVFAKGSSLAPFIYALF